IASSSDPVATTRMRGVPPAWMQAALIVLVSLCLNLVGNGGTSLWDRDEPRYAGCAREMRATGDYVNPTFNAEPRYHKPILKYCLITIGFLVAGDNPYGNRFMSALAGMGTCLVIWSLGNRLFGSFVGLMAAIILATSPLVFVESKLATTDSMLFFF